MTNQQGAPEALRLAAEVLDWMPTSDTQRSLWYRHQEALAVVKAALVEAQQPAAHVQKPAEIEHVAGDVSKNGPESNMAQQPAPSAAETDCWSIHFADERDFCLAASPLIGATYTVGADAAGRINKSPWGRMTFGKVSASQPSPAPQADSQPAPVLDDAFDCACVALNNFSDRASIALILETLRNRVDRVVLAAARAPADSVTAPAGGDSRVPEAWTNLLAYVLQDDLHNRLTPRVIDIAYTAFMQAKRPNDEDGGASDWFNDTRPMVRELIAKLRKDLIEELVTPPAQAADSVLEDAALSQAVRDVLAERQRQVKKEGWTQAHDDVHGDGSLAAAAACYANVSVPGRQDDVPISLWPKSWSPSWWKPKDPRRNLIKAGALILAELERIDRAARKQGANHD